MNGEDGLRKTASERSPNSWTPLVVTVVGGGLLLAVAGYFLWRGWARARTLPVASTSVQITLSRFGGFRLQRGALAEADLERIVLSVMEEELVAKGLELRGDGVAAAADELSVVLLGGEIESGAVRVRARAGKPLGVALAGKYLLQVQLRDSKDATLWTGGILAPEGEWSSKVKAELPGMLEQIRFEPPDPEDGSR